MVSEDVRVLADVATAPSANAGLPPAVPSTPPAEAWQLHWCSTLPQLEAVTRQLRPRHDVSIMRSTQLDAERLDDELGGMLREQFLRAFAFFRPAAIARLQPELTLLLDCLIFRFSIWEGRPLPGMSLMNLRYRNEAPQQRKALSGSSSGSSISNSSTCAQAPPFAAAGGRSGVEGPGLSVAQRSLYFLGAVVLRYAWSRLGHHAAARHWGDRLGGDTWRRRGWVAMQRLESAYRLGTLLNFVAFLKTGRYRSVLERLLRARLVYAQPSAPRAISFEYLNRQLVWSELSELLLFLLPLINGKAIRHAIRSYLPRLPVLTGGGAGNAPASTGSSSKGNYQQPEGPCGICNAAEILEPYAALPCRHIFCYYCVRSRCLADSQYGCPLCLRRVDAMQRILHTAAVEGSNSDASSRVADSDDTLSSAFAGPELSLMGWMRGTGSSSLTQREKSDS